MTKKPLAAAFCKFLMFDHFIQFRKLYVFLREFYQILKFTRIFELHLQNLPLLHTSWLAQNFRDVRDQQTPWFRKICTLDSKNLRQRKPSNSVRVFSHSRLTTILNYHLEFSISSEILEILSQIRDENVCRFPGPRVCTTLLTSFLPAIPKSIRPGTCTRIFFVIQKHTTDKHRHCRAFRTSQPTNRLSENN